MSRPDLVIGPDPAQWPDLEASSARCSAPRSSSITGGRCTIMVASTVSRHAGAWAASLTPMREVQPTTALIEGRTTYWVPRASPQPGLASFGAIPTVTAVSAAASEAVLKERALSARLLRSQGDGADPITLARLVLRDCFQLREPGTPSPLTQGRSNEIVAVNNGFSSDTLLSRSLARRNTWASAGL